MARVFISYASDDGTPAREVHRWVDDDGHDVFLDQDLRDGISVGEEWEQRLHERLRWADAMVCVVTSAYLTSPWCTAEVGIARSRGSRLLPVLAERGVSHPLLKSVEYADMTHDPAGARAMLAEALRRVDADGGWGWPDDRSPFPGLRPFDIDRHQVFFGRTSDVNQLAGLLRSTAERSDSSVLLVVGPSGCGKSSVVRAGLLPVMADEPGWSTLPPIVPGAHPIAALARALTDASTRVGLGWTVAQVNHRLDKEDLTELADELLQGIGADRHHLLIVVDQFEELLTQTEPAELTRFAELVRPALAGPVRLVATLRSEFLDRLLVNSELNALRTHTYTLRPLHREALRAVIEGPARLAGIRVDDDLVAQLVADTDNGEALPLLAFTLAELAVGVGRGGQLLTARYEQLGGVQGALRRQADAALADAVKSGGRKRDLVIAGLLRLVTVDEQGRPTRWRALHDELPGPVASELDAFVARRLLTTDTENGAVVVGVAHEAFLSAWPPLTEAIMAAALALRARRAVEHAAEGWYESKRPPARLWERGQLAAVVTDTGARFATGSDPGLPSPPQPRRRAPWTKRVLVTDRVDLSSRARVFLHASIRRDRYRRGRAMTILSVLLILALVAAVIASIQQGAAEEQQRIATARLLVTQAETARENDPRTALLLGIAAHSIHADVQTQASLVNTLTAPRGRDVGALPESGQAVTVAFSPDGRTLATGSSDGTLSLWQVIDPIQFRRIGPPLTVHDGPVTSMVFAPGGHILAAAVDDGTVILLDVTDPTQPRRLGQPLAGYNRAMAFSPNGRMLTTVNDDDSVNLWDLTDPAQAVRLGNPFNGHGSAPGVSSVAFSQNGSMLATGGYDGTLMLWDLTDPARPQPYGPPSPGHGDMVLSMAFSPNGNYLASGSKDGTAIVWDFISPSRPRPLRQPIGGGQSTVFFVAFTAGGRTLVTASYGGGVTLWDLADSAELRFHGQTLSRHNVNSVALTPDGQALAMVRNGVTPDSAVTLWDLSNPAQPRPLGQPLTGHSGSVTSVAFSADGRTLATASGNGGVILWDLIDPNRPRQMGEPLPSTTGSGSLVAFSPDGHILVTSGDDGTVVLWDLADPSQPRRLGEPLPTDNDFASAVAFSPDGRTLVTGGGYAAWRADGTVILWDVTDLARPQRLGEPLVKDNGLVRSAAFSPDGRILVSASEFGTIILWDLADLLRPRRLGEPLTGHNGGVNSVAFAPAGRTLASGGFDNGTILWDLTDPDSPRRLGQPLIESSGPVFEVAFSSDGRTLATVNVDGIPVLWDLTELARPRRLGQPLTGPSQLAESVAFSPQGNVLATGTRGGFLGNDKTAVNLWDLSVLEDFRESALKHACIIAGRGLDRDEWTLYLPALPYRDTCSG